MNTATTRWLLAGGLLSSIVLSGCVSKDKYRQLEAENAMLQQTISAQTAQSARDEAAIAEGQRQVSRLQGAIKYSVESDLMFEPGSWELSDAGKRTISRMAQKLAPTQTNKLIVTGFADNQPIGPELEKKGITSNQELSQKRAEAVRDFLIEEGADPDLVKAEGRGSANPVASNDTAQGRSQNRRVELSLGG